MKLTYDKLSKADAESQLTTTDGWAIEEGALTKSYSFESYPAGVLFAVAVSNAAERLNHHPDLLIGYKNVRVSMVTHDAGGGLTAFDFELARRIDKI